MQCVWASIKLREGGWAPKDRGHNSWDLAIASWGPKSFAFINWLFAIHELNVIRPMQTGCACRRVGHRRGWQGVGKDAVTTKWRQISGPRETVMQLCMQIAPAGSPSFAKQFINEICWKVVEKKFSFESFFFFVFLVIESREHDIQDSLKLLILAKHIVSLQANKSQIAGSVCLFIRKLRSMIGKGEIFGNFQACLHIENGNFNQIWFRFKFRKLLVTLLRF